MGSRPGTMKLLAGWILLVLVVSATGRRRSGGGRDRQDAPRKRKDECSKIICTTKFFKDLSSNATEYLKKSFVDRQFISSPHEFETKIWQMQKLLFGSLWDLQEYADKLYQQVDVKSRYWGLRSGFMIPKAIRLPYKEFRDAVHSFFQSPDEAPELPAVHKNMILLVDDFIRTRKLESLVLMGLRYLRSAWRVFGSSETAKKDLLTMESLADCLYHRDYNWMRNDVLRFIDEYISTYEALEKHGNFTLANPVRYQQIQDILKSVSGAEEADRIKTRLNSLILENSETIHEELNKMLDAVETVLGFGNGTYQGMEIYLSSLYYMQEDELQQALKNTQVISMIKSVVTYLRAYFYFGRQDLSFEDYLIPIASVPWMLETMSKGLAKLQPMPKCLKTDNFPEIRVYNRPLTLEDYAVLRIFAFCGAYYHLYM